MQQSIYARICNYSGRTSRSESLCISVLHGEGANQVGGGPVYLPTYLRLRPSSSCCLSFLLCFLLCNCFCLWLHCCCCCLGRDIEERKAPTRRLHPQRSLSIRGIGKSSIVSVQTSCPILPCPSCSVAYCSALRRSIDRGSARCIPNFTFCCPPTPNSLHRFCCSQVQLRPLQKPKCFVRVPFHCSKD